MKPYFRNISGIVILLAFVAAVEYFVGWGELLKPWQAVSATTLLVTIALTFVTYVLRTLRVSDYFREELRGQFLLSLKLTLQHNLLNNFLPMRAGEISFPVLMSRYFSIPATRSVPVLLWFRLLDLHTLLTIAVLASGGIWFDPAHVIPIAGLWLTAPWFVHLSQHRLARALASAESGIRRKLCQVLACLPQTTPEFARAWGWTWINWLLKLGVFAWVLLLFAPIPWSAGWLAAMAGDLTSVLPVHGIAGAGTYEAGVIAALLPMGLSAAVALQAAVNLHLFLLGSTVLGGVVGLALPGRASAPAPSGTGA